MISVEKEGERVISDKEVLMRVISEEKEKEVVKVILEQEVRVISEEEVRLREGSDGEGGRGGVKRKREKEKGEEGLPKKRGRKLGYRSGYIVFVS